MKTDDFFKKQTHSSRIKANIVAKYFPQYCRILLKKPQDQLRYLDLFAGPGIYEDGSFSTPLLIAKSCAEDSELSKKVRLLFNDNEHITKLEKNFKEKISENVFFFKPRFANKTVEKDEKINEYLKKKYTNIKNPHPTLLFFDPWGYKGIDTRILGEFMKNWGNEIFLFVNIKRIHPAIENKKFDTLMRSLFPTLFNKIKEDRRYKATVSERLNLIMDNLSEEFKGVVGKELYSTQFKFQEEDSKTTSHFIIHFTKHRRGYELVKQIFYDFDNIGATLDKDGSYTFDAKKMYSKDIAIEFRDQNIETLSNRLEKKYKGKSIFARKLFDEHHSSTKFSETHYIKTLRYMVENNKIKATFNDGREHKVSVLLAKECKCKLKFN